MAVANTTKTSWRLQEIVAHSSNVVCLALGKNSGRLLATGGEDCRVNIWAVSKPNCIMSLTGHNNPVECVKFNNSEEQVVAGSQSGSLRVWDLEAAKILRTLMGHKANICSLDFHPFGEYLASGSMDTNIKLWDVRRKGCVFRYKVRLAPMCNSYQTEEHQVQDDWLFRGRDGTSQVTATFTINKCGWCLAFNLDGFCLYSGAVDSLRVYGWEPDRCFDVVPVGWGKVADLAICNHQLIGVSYNLTNVSSYVVDLTRVKKSGSVIQGVIQDEQPLTEPSPKGSTLRRNYDRPLTTCSTQRVKQSSESDRRSPEGERRSPSSEDEKESSAEIRNPEDYKDFFQPKSAICRVEPTVVATAPRPIPVVTARPPTSNHPPAPHPAPPPVVAMAKAKPQPSVILSTRNEPIGLNVEDFLPPARNNRPSVLGDDEALAQIRKGHDTMCVMLTSRHKNLDTIRAVWGSGDVKTSLDSAVSMKDLSIVVDILNIVNLKPSLWKLDLCTSILPQIEELLQSKYESYVQTGCTSLKLILKRFWPLISDTLTAPPSVGVDITREERHQKCKACYKQLKNLSNVVKNKADQVGRHGSAFKELQLLMAPLDY
uniref:Katanin p80 WD40 repeat-containing subunit B1 n=1 Tax=Hucho hucho TaxID=62062 RepID=A0A4W5MCR3_9TELE